MILPNVISSLNYCTPTSNLCIGIERSQYLNQGALTFTLDYDIGLGTVFFGTGATLDSSNVFIITPNTTSLSIVPQNTATKSTVSLTTDDFNIKITTINNQRGMISFTKSSNTTFFLSEINPLGSNTFSWATLVTGSKVSKKGKFKMSSLSDGYIVDDSDTAKSHGALMLIAFLFFLPVSVIIRKFFKSNQYYQVIYYTSESFLWLFVLISFIIIVVTKKSSAIVSGHAIGSVVILVFFLFIRMIRVIFSLKSFNVLNFRTNPKIPLIYFYINSTMILLSVILGIVAAVDSFSNAAYIVSICLLSVLICAVFGVLFYKHWDEPTVPAFDEKIARSNSSNSRRSKPKSKIQENSPTLSRNTSVNKRPSSPKRKKPSRNNSLKKQTSLLDSSNSRYSDLSEVSEYTMDFEYSPKPGSLKPLSSYGTSTASPLSTSILVDTESELPASPFVGYSDTLKRKPKVSNETTDRSIKEEQKLPTPVRKVKFREAVSIIENEPEVRPRDTWESSEYDDDEERGYSAVSNF